MVLRVILQIVPHGDEESVREIGRLDIFNKGPAVPAIKSPPHKYGVIDLTKDQEGLYSEEIIHYRVDGAWFLVGKALEQLDIR